MTMTLDDDDDVVARGRSLPDDSATGSPRSPQPNGSQHTPGPWRVVTGVCPHDHPDTSADVLGPGHQYIANCGCHETAIANAHAIAALPELLNVAHAAWHALKSYEYGNGSPELARTCAASLELAIAQAEGR